MIIKIYLPQEKKYMYKNACTCTGNNKTEKNSGKATQTLILTEIKPKKTIKLCTLYRDKQKEVFKRKSYSRRYIKFIHYLLNKW